MGETQGDYSAVARAIAQGCDAPLRQFIEQRLEESSKRPARAAQCGDECARLLLERGLLPEAEHLFRSLQDQFPRDPVGYVGLARVAMQRREWAEALERWSEVSAHFPGRGNYFWELARAQTLLSLARLDEAHSLCDKLVEDFPSQPGGLVGLAEIASRRRAWSEARARWTEVLRRFPDESSRFWLMALGRVLIELNSLAEARDIYEELTRRFASECDGWVGLATVAMRAQEWASARACWEQVFERFGPDAPTQWQSGRAIALMELDLLDEAESAFRELLAGAPTEPHGLAGLANIAMRRGEWATALQRWDEVLRRFADVVEPSWQASRAHTLLRLGYADECETLYRSLVRTEPDSDVALSGLMHSLVLLNRPEEAWAALSSLGARCTSSAALVDARLEALLRLRRFGDLRREHGELLRAATDPAVLTTLFKFTPFIHEGASRTQCWQKLYEQVRIAASGSQPHGSVALDVLRLRLWLAQRDYVRFLNDVDRVVERADVGKFGRCLTSIAARLRTSPAGQHEQAKVFGIGLSKTGTTSLAAGLSALGFDTLDWANPLTCELFCDDDLRLFEAFTDTPVCARMEDLYNLYPHAKFIYTTRAAGSWQRSIVDHFRRTLRCADFAQAKKMAIEHPDEFPQGTPHAEVLRSLYFRYTDFAQAFDVYDRRVREFFRDKPAHRFLELNLFSGQGWPELCSFLGRDAPSTPFPWVNRKPRSRRPSLGP